MSFLDKTINELINTEFPCSCGETHIANIQNIAIGKGAIEKVPAMIDKQVIHDDVIFNKDTDTIFVVSDVNTEAVAGKDVKERLAAAGYKLADYVYPHKAMHAEDCYVDEMREHLPEGVSLIIAVGSGSLNDITRFVAFKAGIPYYIIATAPSMDGYASNVSPLVHNNLKITYPAECAAAIVGDTNYLATAPDHMIAAGLGDILGKYLAINDWKISHIINDEYICDEVCDLVLFSVQKCVDTVPGLVARDSEALTNLMEALVLIGIAMSYIGFSRPASSSEHHISHFLEMKSIFNGEYGELHGTNVGMSTCLIGEMYKSFFEKDINFDKAREHAKAFDHDAWVKEIQRSFGPGADEVIKLYETAQQNNPEKVVARIDAIEANKDEVFGLMKTVGDKLAACPDMLKALNGLTDPSGYPLSHKDLVDILTYAKELRNRYGTLQIFYDLDVLDDLAEEMATRYMK